MNTLEAANKHMNVQLEEHPEVRQTVDLVRLLVNDVFGTGEEHSKGLCPSILNRIDLLAEYTTYYVAGLSRKEIAKLYVFIVEEDIKSRLSLAG